MGRKEGNRRKLEEPTVGHNRKRQPGETTTGNRRTPRHPASINWVHLYLRSWSLAPSRANHDGRYNWACFGDGPCLHRRGPAKKGGRETLRTLCDKSMLFQPYLCVNLMATVPCDLWAMSTIWATERVLQVAPTICTGRRFSSM